MPDRELPLTEANRGTGGPWQRYLAAFHDSRPAITERLLSRCDRSPYSWLVEPIEQVDGLVLDLACGSAPTRALLPVSAEWLGVDTSAGELGYAAAAGRGPVVRAAAGALPLADDQVAGVIAAMCLPVVSPLDAVLDEVVRVTEPGGVLTALVPARLGFDIAGAYRWLRIMTALGVRAQPWPNPQARDHLPTLLRRRGFQIRSSQRRTFVLTLRGDADAQLLVESLYLPHVTARRLDDATRLLARQFRNGVTVSLPLRRVVAETPASG
ncbi:class I SAM-dependent methyltransferase [Amycolatopsis sp. H20-H5]|uniref:class I SAM-dependent methyltransferase n=1 Tax=Amycolatopsis sp. H20-H5 TaxID=3046309 RepID=UPI002DBC8171|nr:class I SAM-dependent methyltransferase [Amycolatopsis sp. H20-H5]MEC3975850.1 class I SAM-dependent methyltransferase [Amycolatopsis sp. H20-H5]